MRQPGRAQAALRIAASAAFLLATACGSARPPAPMAVPAPSTPPPADRPWTEVADAEEALDLLATWDALVSSSDPAIRAEFERPKIVHRLVSADGATSVSRVDATRRQQVCGDVHLQAVPGGYDVAVPVVVVRDDGLLRWGTRHLEMRGPPGFLRVTADTFRVEHEQPADLGRRIGSPYLCTARVIPTCWSGSRASDR